MTPRKLKKMSLLAEKMEEAELSVGELARLLGVDSPVVSQWRTEAAPIRAAVLSRLVRVLNRKGAPVTADELVQAHGVTTREGQPSPPSEERASAAAFRAAYQAADTSYRRLGGAMDPGVSQETIRNWLRDGPPMSRVPALARALNVEEQQLLSNVEGPEIPVSKSQGVDVPMVTAEVGRKRRKVGKAA